MFRATHKFNTFVLGHPVAKTTDIEQNDIDFYFTNVFVQNKSLMSITFKNSGWLRRNRF